jgi:hypothetical protein
MGLDVSKVDKVYYNYICDKAVFFHPDIVDSQDRVNFPIKNCDIFVINLKAILVIPGDKLLHYFRHYNRFNTGVVIIDDITGAYLQYFLSKRYDQALILSYNHGVVNISWHNDDGRFVTTIDNTTGDTKTVSVE